MQRRGLDVTHRHRSVLGFGLTLQSNMCVNIITFTKLIRIASYKMIKVHYYSMN